MSDLKLPTKLLDQAIAMQHHSCAHLHRQAMIEEIAGLDHRMPATELAG